MAFMEKEFADMIQQHRDNINIEERPRDLIDAYVRAIEKEKSNPNTTFTGIYI